jgi:hypothetical protein
MQFENHCLENRFSYVKNSNNQQVKMKITLQEYMLTEAINNVNRYNF